MNTLNNFSSELEVMNKLTLGQIVSKDFRAAAVFEKYNLDFCCNGNKSFTEACRDKGLNEQEILSEIKNAHDNSVLSSDRFNGWELDFLADYIINNHHNYIKNMVPVIAAHSTKVASVHGKNHPEVTKISEIFSALSKELSQHLMKEEQILFPYIKNLVKIKNDNSKFEPPYFSTVANPIKMMEAEHTSAGNEMNEIRELSNSYLIPQDACNTFKVFYKELKEFEEDLHIHIYLENNILFPKSMELENRLLKENSNKFL